MSETIRFMNNATIGHAAPWMTNHMRLEDDLTLIKRQSELLSMKVREAAMQAHQQANAPEQGIAQAPEAPIGRAKAYYVKALEEAMEYLLIDIRDNIRRNPALGAIGTNWAMRQAQHALDDLRACK